MTDRLPLARGEAAALLVGAPTRCPPDRGEKTHPEDPNDRCHDADTDRSARTHSWAAREGERCETEQEAAQNHPSEPVRVRVTGIVEGQRRDEHSCAEQSGSDGDASHVRTTSVAAAWE